MWIVCVGVWLLLLLSCSGKVLGWTSVYHRLGGGWWWALLLWCEEDAKSAVSGEARVVLR